MGKRTEKDAVKMLRARDFRSNDVSLAKHIHVRR